MTTKTEKIKRKVTRFELPRRECTFCGKYHLDMLAIRVDKNDYMGWYTYVCDGCLKAIDKFREKEKNRK